MKLLRLCLLALSLSLATAACQGNITGPDAENTGWAGSGGQKAPVSAPSYNTGWAGSGG